MAKFKEQCKCQKSCTCMSRKSSHLFVPWAGSLQQKCREIIPSPCHQSNCGDNKIAHPTPLWTVWFSPHLYLAHSFSKISIASSTLMPGLGYEMGDALSQTQYLPSPGPRAFITVCKSYLLLCLIHQILKCVEAKMLSVSSPSICPEPGPG